MAHFFLALARGLASLGRILVGLVIKQPRPNEDENPTAARARFWAELREGQREAKALATKPGQ